MSPLLTTSLKGLARWVAIRLRWGELAHAMDEEPGLLAGLERSALKGAGAIDPDESVSEEHRKWLDPAEFEDLPALRAIFGAGTDGERMSDLPFDRFIRIRLKARALAFWRVQERQRHRREERRHPEVVVGQAGQDRQGVPTLRPPRSHPATVPEPAIEQLEGLDVMAGRMANVASAAATC